MAKSKIAKRKQTALSNARNSKKSKISAPFTTFVGESDIYRLKSVNTLIPDEDLAITIETLQTLSMLSKPKDTKISEWRYTTFGKHARLV